MKLIRQHLEAIAHELKRSRATIQKQFMLPDNNEFLTPDEYAGAIWV